MAIVVNHVTKMFHTETRLYNVGNDRVSHNGEHLACVANQLLFRKN